MNRTVNKPEFNPSGVGLNNGNFIGLPFSEENAKIVLLPVPWDVTVSYGEGTAFGPLSVLNASVQLDLSDYDVSEAWKLGIYMKQIDQGILDLRNSLRPKSQTLINFLEKGGDSGSDYSMKNILEEINSGCEWLNDRVYKESKKLIDKGKIVAVVGGDHSVPLGYIKTLQERYKSFGVLQIDAHMDLRESYEGFRYSHASVFYNVLKFGAVTKLVQVGIRDYCEEELCRAKEEGSRVSQFFDQKLKESRYEGADWSSQCSEIVSRLPELVYISVDADGLDPKLCPHTGTPVPGGLEYYEVIYLFKKIVESDRRIIGFDICETGNDEWDGNVGARLIYKLCNLTGRSQGLI